MLSHHHQQEHGVLEAIHEAALKGDVAAIDRLVAEDGRRTACVGLLTPHARRLVRP
jgi:hypothetical protein